MALNVPRSKDEWVKLFSHVNYEDTKRSMNANTITLLKVKVGNLQFNDCLGLNILS